MKGNFTLGKNERLKSRKAIDELFVSGKKISANGFRVHYGLKENAEGLKFGVGVSTKNFKRAVDRNRIKRLVRESFRLQKMDLKDKLQTVNRSLDVFFIYTGKELPEYKNIFTSVGSLLKKLEAAI